MIADPITRRLAELAEHLAGSDIRIATAESCTGGQVAAELAGHADLGSHLERGYVVYSVDAKCDMLGIARSLAERSQGVGAEVTLALAEGALDRSRADLAIAITAFCGGAGTAAERSFGHGSSPPVMRSSGSVSRFSRQSSSNASQLRT